MSVLAEARIPGKLLEFLKQRAAGDIVGCTQLGGGTINRSYRLDTAAGSSFVVKLNDAGLTDIFPLEGKGLGYLQAAGVPVAEVVDAQSEYILLEWIENPGGEDIQWEAFGRAVAAMHGIERDSYGWHDDNYCGGLKVRNDWQSDGYRFFGENRVLNFLHMPRCDEHFDKEDRQKIERMLKRLPDLIPVQPASLLHGDLWSANVVGGPGGQLKLIDPSPFYGWAELDLAPTFLYGGFPDAFYGAYLEMRPLEEGFLERVPLYAMREWLAIVAQSGDVFGCVHNVKHFATEYS